MGYCTHDAVPEMTSPTPLKQISLYLPILDKAMRLWLILRRMSTMQTILRLDTSPRRSFVPSVQKSFCCCQYHSFLGYQWLCSEKPVNRSIMSIKRLDAWMVTSIHCLKVHENRGGRHEKLLADTFRALLPKAIDYFVGAIRQYVAYWNPDEMEIFHMRRFLLGNGWMVYVMRSEWKPSLQQ